MKIRFAFAACAIGLAIAAAARAEEPPRGASAWAESEQAQLRIVSKSIGLGDNGRTWIGLQFKMEPGWHTYWRTPGDAGLPPAISFEGSENLRRYAVRWPVPQRAVENGLETFVYRDEVVLPILVEAADRQSPLNLNLHIMYGICKEICIPHEASLSMKLQPNAPGETTFTPLIDGYLARVPRKASEHGVRVEKSRDGTAVDFRLSKPVRQPYLIVEFAEGYARAIEPLDLAPGRLGIRFDLSSVDLKGKARSSQRPVLVLVDGDRAYEALLP